MSLVRVKVTRIRMRGSTAIGWGMTVDEPRQRVTFMGDWRPMQELGEAVDRGEKPTASIESWQIIERS